MWVGVWGWSLIGRVAAPSKARLSFPSGLSGFCQSFQFPLLWTSVSLFSFPVVLLGLSLPDPLQDPRSSLQSFLLGLPKVLFCFSHQNVSRGSTNMCTCTM